MSNLPPVMDDDEFFMLLSYYNSYGFPLFPDVMASPADASPQVSTTTPVHELYHDWMPQNPPVPSFMPDRGTPISTVSSLPTTPAQASTPPFLSPFPSTPNSNQIDFLHSTSPQWPTFFPIAIQDYELFSNSPEFHTMLDNSQMPTGKAESPKRIERQRLRQAPYHVDRDDEGAMNLDNFVSQQALSETPGYEAFARDKDTARSLTKRESRSRRSPVVDGQISGASGSPLPKTQPIPYHHIPTPQRSSDTVGMPPHLTKSARSIIRRQARLKKPVITFVNNEGN